MKTALHMCLDMTKCALVKNTITYKVTLRGGKKRDPLPSLTPPTVLYGRKPSTFSLSLYVLENRGLIGQQALAEGLLEARAELRGEIGAIVIQQRLQLAALLGGDGADALARLGID